jgi:hypothetical protein
MTIRSAVGIAKASNFAPLGSFELFLSRRLAII